MYTCMFHNANRTKSKFNGNEIKTARDNYVRLQALQANAGDSSSADGLSDEDPYPAASKEPNNRHEVIAHLVTIPGTQGEPELLTDTHKESVAGEASANTTGDEVSVEGQTQDSSITRKEDQSNTTKNGNEGNDNRTKQGTLEESVTDATNDATSSKRDSDNTTGEIERVALTNNDGSITKDDHTNTTTNGSEGSDNAPKKVTLEESVTDDTHDASSSKRDTDNTTGEQESGAGTKNDGSITQDAHTNITTNGSEGSNNATKEVTLEESVADATLEESVADATNDASSTKVDSGSVSNVSEDNYEPGSGSVGNVSSPNATLVPPTRLYTKEDKKLKQRVFPCPGCGEGADGSHQCGDCFAHVHVICGRPYEASTEGYGQLVHCEQCRSDHEDDDTADMTQEWQEDLNVTGKEGIVKVGSPHNDATQERQELAAFIAALPGTQVEPAAPAQERHTDPGYGKKKKRRLELRNELIQLHNKKHKKGTAAHATAKKRKWK